MIRELAWREIVVRARTKAYRLATLTALVAPIALLLAVSYFAGDDEPEVHEIGFVGAVGDDSTADYIADYMADLEAFAGDDQISSRQFASVAEGEERLRDGAIDVLVGPDGAVWAQSVDRRLSSLLDAAHRQRQIRTQADEMGLSQADLATLLVTEPLERTVLDGREADFDDARFLAGMLAAVITFVMIQVYGSLVLMGVVEEKASGVIEVLLSQVRPRALLAGKVFGIGALVVAQVLALVAGVVIGVTLTGDFAIPPEVWALLPVLVATILGGFVLYAATFAVAGSLVSRQEDAQQAAIPLIIPLMGGYIGGLAQGQSTLRVVLSFVPFTSPMVLPSRIVAGSASPGQVSIALGLLAITVWGVLTVGGRIYEVMLLRTGTRVGWWDAVRSLRS